MARLRALHALILVNSARSEEGRMVAQQAETEGLTAGDWLPIGYALHAQSMVHRRRQEYSALLDTLDRALAAISESAEAADLRLILLGNRAEVLSTLGRPAAAVEASALALSLAAGAGTPLRQSLARVQSAELCVRLGRWDDATAQLAIAAETALDAARWPWLRGLAALIAVHRD